jgi:thiamine pyrophosphokinase
LARTAAIVIGGADLDRRVLAHLPPDRLVIAADSGFDIAVRAGLRVDVVVGDLDSISPDGLAAALDTGVTVDRHPVDKDATDTELAVAAAVQQGAERLIGLSGGPRADDVRLDHELAALLTFADPKLAGCDVEAWWGRAHIRFVHGPRTVEIVAAPGSLVSLLPVHGDAAGVRTAGLRYPLAGETLGGGTSRGISNEVVAEHATVTLDRGALLVVEPDALGGAP